jgi:threonylcarbamoyladenosine tRNA methylthiotransferase MtaB
MSLDVVTFGCRLNAFESEVMRQHARAAGLEDAVIVNTCSVTAEATRQARQAIRKARRERPGATLIVTGCAAQLEPARFAAMAEVDRVLGNEEKLRAESFAPTEAPRVQVNDIMAVADVAGHLIEGFDGRARAFVQVQQGCDHRCSFCIIPFARGNNRSVPVADIVAQVRRLVENGYAEVVLTGVDLTAYGADRADGPSLGEMVRRLLDAVPELPRLRLSSLDPAEVDDTFLRLVAEEPRLMPHLHLSLQAGDDVILKRMKRRHSRAQAVGFCQMVRRLRPDVVFGADLIAGFPTESEAAFQSSLDLIDDCGLTHLHVFTYSARPGTPAARMPQVAKPLRKERAARLRDKGAAAFGACLRGQVGGRARVLIETPGRGHSEQFLPVRTTAETAPGDIVEVAIAAADAATLSGRPVA